jgi:hypothetical protein
MSTFLWGAAKRLGSGDGLDFDGVFDGFGGFGDGGVEEGFIVGDGTGGDVIQGC